jgi:hypothetical protein
VFDIATLAEYWIISALVVDCASIVVAPKHATAAISTDFIFMFIVCCSSVGQYFCELFELRE